MCLTKKLIVALAMLVCFSVRPAAARGLCESELRARSPSGTASTTITYTNNGTAEELWVWLDHDGNRKLYQTLKPGDVVRQKTFVGHYWIVTNKGEDCELMVRAEAGDAFKTVYEDVPAAKKDFAKRVGLPDGYLANWAKTPASCQQASDQLAVAATGYKVGQSNCTFVEGPVAMEGGFQGTVDCGGKKHEIRMTQYSGLLTVQGAGVTLDKLTKCGTAMTVSTASSDDAGQQCSKMGNDDTVRSYSPALRKNFNAAFSDAKGPPAAADLKTGVYRCMDAHLVGCLVGANLPCFKMNATKRNAGAETFCRDNPNSDSVPLVASGHGSVYEYKCFETRAEIKDTMYKLDKRGFARDLWKLLN